MFLRRRTTPPLFIVPSASTEAAAAALRCSSAFEVRVNSEHVKMDAVVGDVTSSSERELSFSSVTAAVAAVVVSVAPTPFADEGDARAGQSLS